MRTSAQVRRRWQALVSGDPAIVGDSAYLSFPPARVTANLRAFNSARRRRTRSAADALVDCLRMFVETGQVPLAAAVGGSTVPQAWQHYQPDVAAKLDGTPGALHYYYHSHASPGATPAEHGHFHLFAQLGHDAAGAARYTHLVAIGVDARGMPCRLFTTNRWVTGETWLPAARVLTLIEQIAAMPAANDDPVDRWLRAQLGAFAPQVVELVRHRDRRMASRRRGGRRPGLFDDRRMHVICQCSVSVERQLAAIDRVFH